MPQNEAAYRATMAFVDAAASWLREAGAALRESNRMKWVREGDICMARSTTTSYLDVHEFRDSLHALPEFKTAVSALHDDERIASQLGTELSTDIGSSRVFAEDLLESVLAHALTPDMTADAAALTEAYEHAEGVLYAETFDCVVVAPFPDLRGNMPVQLDADSILDTLTADEVGACALFGALRPFPASQFMAHPVVTSVGGVAGLRFRYLLPKTLGAIEGFPSDTFWTDVSARIERLTLALRLLRPEFIGASGYIYTRQDVLLPRQSWSVGFTPMTASRSLGLSTYVLDDTYAADLVELDGLLASPAVVGHKTLPLALRRFMYAGDRDRADDQLIDLMISAEALFLPGEKMELSHKLALRAAYFLADRRRDKRQTFAFMKKAYSARGDLVHGEALGPLRVGERTFSPQEFAYLTFELMRETLVKAVRIASGTAPGSIDAADDFDALMLDTQHESAAD